MSIKKVINKIYTQYLNMVFKSITLDKTSRIDYRCEIAHKNNITIGKRSILYKNITIYKNREGNLKIGDDSHIAPFGYFLMEGFDIAIGNSVAIAKNCSLFCVSNNIPTNSATLFKDSYSKGDIIIGDNVFIGTNCVVLPNTIIPDNVVIGANSTVKGELESGYLYGGNPAKKIRKLFI